MIYIQNELTETPLAVKLNFILSGSPQLMVLHSNELIEATANYTPMSRPNTRLSQSQAFEQIFIFID